MAGAAITARLGLDASEFRSGLNAAAVASKAFKEKEARAAAAAEKARKNEGGLKSDNKVENAGTELAMGLVEAKTGADALGKGVEALAKSLNLSLGAAVATNFVAGMWKRFNAELEVSKGLVKDLREELDKPVGDMGIDGILAKMKTLDDLRKKVADDRGPDEFRNRFMKSLSNVFTLGGTFKNTLAGETADKQAMERKFELSQKIAEMVERETALKQKAAGNEKETELLEARLALEKKIAAIRMSSSIFADAKGAMIAAAEAESAIVQQGIIDKATARQSEIAVAKDLLLIQMRGEDVALRTAHVRLSAAKTEASIARTDDAYSLAQAKVAAAREAVAEAEKQTKLLREQQALERSIADMRAPAAAKDRARLEGEMALLRKEREGESGDRGAELDVALARKREQLRALDDSDSASARAARESGVMAGTGRGEAEQIRSKQLLLEIAQRYLKVMEQTGSGTLASRAAARASAQAMKNDLDEMKEKRELGIKVAGIETRIMRAELDGQETLAKALRVKLGYEERIAAARRDGNTHLETELRAQQKISMQQQAKDVAQERRERLQLSLGELVEEGTGKAGTMARRAATEERRARKRAAAGDIDGAKRHQDRADQIKRGISGLKDSEKDLQGKFKGALDESQVLKDIKAGTDKLGKIL